MKHLTAADILTAPVLTVPKDWPIGRLTTFLTDNNVSGVPVTNGTGEVVGVVSMTDIVRHGTVPARPDDEAHDYYEAGAARTYHEHELRGFHVESEHEITVGELMTPMLFEVSENAALPDIADMMVRGGIHRVLVTKDRMLVGIVTALDVLAAVRDA